MSNEDCPEVGCIDLCFPSPEEELPFTGERYTSSVAGPIRSQHHHRYLFASHFCEGRDVLDIACGEGYGSALLARLARSVIGVDVDAGAVGFALRNYVASNLSFRQGDAGRIEDRERFDVVVSFETIEHLADHEAFLNGLKQALRPGGLLILSSPDRDVYTDADSHENAYHLKELDRAEFKTLVSRRFRHAAFFEQDSITGSLICCEAGASARIDYVSSADGRHYRRTNGLPQAHYLIAVASDETLPPISSSVLDDLHLSKLQQAHEVHAVSLAREVSIRDAEIRRLQKALAEAESRARDLTSDIKQIQDVVEEHQRHLAAIMTSTSWRASAPIRRLGELTSHIRRRLHALTVPVARSRRRAPGAPPRILFVDWTVPKPDQDSGSLDLWHQFGLFKAMGYDVAFLPMISRASDAPYVAGLRKIGVGYLSGSAEASPEALLKDCAADFDMIVLDRIHVAARLIPLLRRCAPTTSLVFNTVDLHFLREEREAALDASPEKAQAAAERRNAELRCMMEADATIVLSEEEGRMLASLVPDAKIHVIPFARPVSAPGPDFSQRGGVLFVGGFLHAPNVDAAVWLASDIWPAVRRALPGAELDIVGSNAPARIRDLDDPNLGIHVRGFVQDLEPLLSNARLTVAPLRFGAGIKGKVAMSLAAGVPCVATPIASEGMGLTNGESILIGQDAREIAAAIVRLHEDESLWRTLASNGKDVLAQRYSFQNIGSRFITLAEAVGVPVPSAASERVAGYVPLPWSL